MASKNLTLVLDVIGGQLLTPEEALKEVKRIMKEDEGLTESAIFDVILAIHLSGWKRGERDCEERYAKCYDIEPVAREEKLTNVAWGEKENQTKEN